MRKRCDLEEKCENHGLYLKKNNPNPQFFSKKPSEKSNARRFCHIVSITEEAECAGYILQVNAHGRTELG